MTALADSLGLQGELAAEIAEALVSLSVRMKKREWKRNRRRTQGLRVLFASQSNRAQSRHSAGGFKQSGAILWPGSRSIRFRAGARTTGIDAAQIYHYYEPLDSWKSKRSPKPSWHCVCSQICRGAPGSGAMCLLARRDYERALAEFGAAATLSPSDAEIGRLIASIKRRQGKWQESLQEYERVQKTDPQNQIPFANLSLPTPRSGAGRAARWAMQMRTMAPPHWLRKFKAVMSILVEG
jgi:tetratricopeptide (TPR) repeat protein